MGCCGLTTVGWCFVGFRGVLLLVILLLIAMFLYLMFVWFVVFDFCLVCEFGFRI